MSIEKKLPTDSLLQRNNMSIEYRLSTGCTPAECYVLLVDTHNRRSVYNRITDHCSIANSGGIYTYIYSGFHSIDIALRWRAVMSEPFSIDILRLWRVGVAPKRTYKHIPARCRKRMSEKSITMLQVKFR